MLGIFTTLLAVWIAYKVAKVFFPALFVKEMVCIDCYSKGKPAFKSGVFTSQAICGTCSSEKIVPISTERAKEILARKAV